MKTILTLIGISSFIIGLIWRYRLNRYDFNNRISSERYMHKGKVLSRDTVEHKSYSSANWHKLSKGLGDLLIIGGLLLGLYGYFLYDPYGGNKPSNWNSMTSDQKRMWKYYQDNPEEHKNKMRLHKFYIYDLVKDKEFDDWAKELEKETGLSHLYWRDIADSTNKHTSFQKQEELMRKDGYDRASILNIKNTFEYNPNDPLDVWKKKMKDEPIIKNQKPK